MASNKVQLGQTTRNLGRGGKARAESTDKTRESKGDFRRAARTSETLSKGAMKSVKGGATATGKQKSAGVLLERSTRPNERGASERLSVSAESRQRGLRSSRVKSAQANRADRGGSSASSTFNPKDAVSKVRSNPAKALDVSTKGLTQDSAAVLDEVGGAKTSFSERITPMFGGKG